MFSPGVERALRVALSAHEGQLRKSLEPVPYVVHPLHVALILARLGAGDVVLQAGLLHDVVEDCDDWTNERIEREFGADVRAIVAELSEDKSKSWAERKQWAVDHVRHMSSEAATVKAADKLHNLKTLLFELESAGDRATVWSKFKGGRERTIAMSSELVNALAARVDARLATELRATMDAIARMPA